MKTKKRIIWLTGLWLFATNLSAQNQTLVEKWREEAYQARTQGDFYTAETFYRKILRVNPGDYDATLALARLYVKTEKYRQAEKLFKQILKNDPSDAEAHKGLGDVYLYTGQLSKAVYHYKKAVKLTPGYVPFYFDLARAYIWSDQIENAKKTYRQILQIDNTYAEAWQGLGKMYYWTEKPYTALQYYKKALHWDPTNSEIRREYNEIKRETAWKLKAGTKKVLEKEENYQIDAWSAQTGFSKRLSNAWSIDLKLSGDYGIRDFYTYNQWDTTRIYNDAALKIGFIKNNYKIFLFGGFTPSDNRFSSYGFDFRPSFDAGKWKITMDLSGGYEYFYYWNEVGKHFGKFNLRFQHKSWDIRINTEGGITDKTFIADVPGNRYEEDYNPFYGAGADIYFRIFSKPDLKISMGYSYLTYAYKSPRYYSPLGRHLIGPGVIFYYPVGHFYLYADFGAHYGIEHYFEETTAGNGNNQGKTRIETVYLQYLNLSGNAEAGFEAGRFSVSFNIGGFQNPYYQNLIVGLMLNYAW